MFPFNKSKTDTKADAIKQYIHTKMLDFGLELNTILFRVLANNKADEIDNLKHKINSIIKFVIYYRTFIETEELQTIIINYDCFEDFTRHVTSIDGLRIMSMPNKMQLDKLYDQLIGLILSKHMVSSGDVKLLIQQNQVTKAQLDQLQKEQSTWQQKLKLKHKKLN